VEGNFGNPCTTDSADAAVVTTGEFGDVAEPIVAGLGLADGFVCTTDAVAWLDVTLFFAVVSPLELISDAAISAFSSLLLESWPQPHSSMRLRPMAGASNFEYRDRF
jgi:hypothetical protein